MINTSDSLLTDHLFLNRDEHIPVAAPLMANFITAHHLEPMSMTMLYVLTEGNAAIAGLD